MNTIESLKKGISELVAAERSGIVALCGDAYSPAEDESLWEYHDALVYVQPLDTVVAFTSWGTTYQAVDGRIPADSLLERFIGREDMLTVGELGMSEQEYLDVCTDCLLNDMAHDEDECPEQDCEDYDGRYQYSSEDECWYPDTHYTITGATDVPEDIRAFRAATDNGDELSVTVREGGRRRFCVSVNADGEYVLSTFERDEIQDTETGEKVPVQVRVQLLRALDWRTFYAKSRLFIYRNWVRICMLE